MQESRCNASSNIQIDNMLCKLEAGNETTLPEVHAFDKDAPICQYMSRGENFHIRVFVGNGLGLGGLPRNKRAAQRSVTFSPLA